MSDAPDGHAGSGRRVKVIAVTGGKGGVGKSCVCANLAVALSTRGRAVMMLDADLGLANLDVMLGLRPERTLADVLAGRCELDDIVLGGPGGTSLVPAASGIAGMASLSAQEHAGIIQAFSGLRRDLDVLLIDTAAGLSPSVLMFGQAAQELLVVVCDEPASLTDAYALIKVLSRDHGVSRFRMVANRCASLTSARDLHHRLVGVCDRFLDVIVEFAGYVPDDEFLRRSVRQQRPVVAAYPGSPSALAFKKLAAAADTWSVPRGARGHLEFFVERLVLARPRTASVLQ
ncbi:MAG: MinD/ParA family protein [Steroidobacteraceae bacterium]